MKYAVFAIVMMFTPFAYSHGDYNWIKNTPKISYCCGPSDCHKIKPEDMTIRKNGWIFTLHGQIHFVPRTHKSLYPSVNRDFHACLTDGNKGQVRCFFIPYGAV